MNDLIQAISVVGFPAVSFLIAAYFIKYTYDKTQEANKEAMARIGELAEAVNKNTDTLARLVDKLDKEDKSYG